MQPKLDKWPRVRARCTPLTLGAPARTCSVPGMLTARQCGRSTQASRPSRRLVRATPADNTTATAIAAVIATSTTAAATTTFAAATAATTAGHLNAGLLHQVRVGLVGPALSYCPTASRARSRSRPLRSDRARLRSGCVRRLRSERVRGCVRRESRAGSTFRIALPDRNREFHELNDDASKQVLVHARRRNR